MADALKVLGSCYLKIDGQLYKTVPDSVEITFGGREVTAMPADETIVFQEGPLVPSMIAAEFLLTEKFDVKKINELSGATIEVITNIGVSYVMPKASRTGAPISAASGTGRVRAQFQGDPIPGL